MAALAIWIYTRYRLRKSGIDSQETLYVNTSESQYILAHGYKAYKKLVKKAGTNDASIGIILSEENSASKDDSQEVEADKSEEIVEEEKEQDKHEEEETDGE